MTPKQGKTSGMPSTAWYGKVPARGDFVGKGLSADKLKIWDGWLQRGLKTAAQRLGHAELDHRLRGFPAWRFLAWPDGLDGAALAGVMVASQDRVGRAFPLTLMQAFPSAAPGWVEIEAAMARLADAALDTTDQPVVEDFESMLLGLGDVFAPGPQPAAPPLAEQSPLELLRRSPAHRSLWWIAPPPGAAPLPLADDWPPHDELLLDILASESAGI